MTCLRLATHCFATSGSIAGRGIRDGWLGICTVAALHRCKALRGRASSSTGSNAVIGKIDRAISGS